MYFILGGDSSGVMVQDDTIFVSGMDPEANEADIAIHFGSIGIIKVKCKLLWRQRKSHWLITEG